MKSKSILNTQYSPQGVLRTIHNTPKNSFQKTNLIQLLETFSKEEMTEFDKFVRSPFFNNRSEVTRFFQTIKKFHPGFDDENFTKEKVFAKLHPKEKYRDDVIRRMSSELYGLGEKYLIYKKNDEFPIENRLKLMSILGERRLDSQFDKLEKEVSMELEEFPYRNDIYFKFATEFYTSKCYVEATRYNIKNHGQEEVNSFLNYAIIFLLNTFGGMQNDDKIFGKNYDYSFLNFLLYYLDNKKNDLEPAMSIYLLMVMCNLKRDDEKLFDNYKNTFFKYSKVLEDSEQINILVNLLNYCKDKIFQGHYKYFYIQYELYKFKIKKGLFRKYTSLSDVTGIIRSACYNKQFQWALKFLEDFKDKIDPVQKENAINYSLGIINQSLKKYDSSLNYLSKVVTSNLNDKLMIKELFLINFFEIKDFESAYFLVDSSKHFIKNHKLEERQQFDSFLKFYEKLLIIKEKNEIHKLKNLRDELLPHSYFPLKNWFLEKIEEMEKGS